MTPDTDVFTANVAIQARFVPGITVIVAAADEVTASFVISGFIDRASLLTQAEALAAMEAAETEFFATLPIGGTKITPSTTGKVWGNEVLAKASESAPGIFKVELAGSDVTLALNEVAVSDLTFFATLVTQ